VGNIVTEIERQAGHLPDRMNDARDTFSNWRKHTRRFARNNPGTLVLGAFAIGYALAKVARHA
jgi:hypothetical protein